MITAETLMTKSVAEGGGEEGEERDNEGKKC